jgi:hypothetical protein
MLGADTGLCRCHHGVARLKQYVQSLLSDDTILPVSWTRQEHQPLRVESVSCLHIYLVNLQFKQKA